jgi:hypothetical protein
LKDVAGGRPPLIAEEGVVTRKPAARSRGGPPLVEEEGVVASVVALAISAADLLGLFGGREEDPLILELPGGMWAAYPPGFPLCFIYNGEDQEEEQKIQNFRSRLSASGREMKYFRNHRQTMVTDMLDSLGVVPKHQ